MRKFIFALLLVLLPRVASGQDIQKSPKLSLKDLRGRTINLGDYRGKVVLLNFWATWCPPCRAEVPDLVKWQSEYKGRGLQVVGVTYPPTDLKEMRQFVRQLNINYPVLLGSRDTKTIFFAGETLPVTVVIDREGNVRELIEGILLPEEFEEKIKPLLRQAAGERVRLR